MKQLISFAIMSVILCLTTSQVNSPKNPPKEYTVTLPIEHWQNIMDCLEKSNETHLKVKAAQEAILPQLQKQIADTTKSKK